MAGYRAHQPPYNKDHVLFIVTLHWRCNRQRTKVAFRLVWFGSRILHIQGLSFFFVPLMITTSFRFSTHKLSPCFFMHTILLLYNAAAFGYRKLIEIALDTAIHHAVCRFVHWKLKATRTETTQKHKLADTLNLRLRNRNRELRMHGHNNKKT